MAGVCSKTENREIEVLMTCCLGDHPLQDPRLLPCQHSFCTRCIKDKVGKGKKEFVCPKCHLTIPLTEKEVEQLPENVLHHIIEEIRHKTDCVTCGFDDKKTPGTFQCLDCTDVLCDECRVGHTKSSLTRSHRVVAVKDITEGKYKSEIQTEKQLFCDTHSKPNRPKEFEFYCKECKCLACSLCIHKGHQGHDCKLLDEMNDEKTTTVIDHVTDLLEMKTFIRKFSDVLKQQDEENKELREKLENEVHDRAAKIMEVIEKVKEDTLEFIKGHFEKEDTALQTKLLEADTKMVRIDSIVNYTKAFLKHSGKPQFLQHEHEMMKKLTEQKQQKMETTLKRNILKLGQPQYDKTEVFLKEAFGTLTTTAKTPIVTQQKEVHRVLMKEPEVLFHNKLGDGSMRGITITNTEDIVTVVGSSLKVYSSDLQHKGTITQSQQLDPFNLVAKEDNLYASLNYGGQVFIFDFKGNVKKKITLPQSNLNFIYRGLAVDDEGNVYVSSYGTSTIYKCRPDETNAKVFIQQGTHPDLKGSWYLNVTSGGEVIVSNVSSNTIQVYNRQGVLLWQYKGEGDMRLSGPRGVCCDSQGYIYIADYDNQRIQVIKDATFVGCIKFKDFTNPRSITLDKDDNIVCCNDSGFIVKAKCWV